MKRMDVKIPSFLFIIVISAVLSCRPEMPENHQPTVEVRYENGRAVLYRHGSPYYIKGAAGTEHMDKVAAFGGNSIRTWDLEDADSILDKAHELGLTVTLGIEIGRPLWGNDFAYWKTWEVAKKVEEIRPFVEKYKDHPALLMWGVGNEVKGYGGGTRLEVYYITNQVAKMVKEVDPNHPTMTALNHSSKIDFLTPTILSNIDILGFNAFRDLNRMSGKVYGEDGWKKAYIFSEWGTWGHWQAPETEWGAPKELKDAEKRHAMEQNWNTMLQDSSLLLGAYAFYWGYKHEGTQTWFSFFSEEGLQTPSLQFLKEAWSGKTVENAAPNVSDISIENPKSFVRDNFYLESDKIYTASALAEDPEADSLEFIWEIRDEENYFLDKNYSNPIDSLIVVSNGPKVQFKTPKDEGPFRVFVYALDGRGNFSSYNIPFYVIKR
jgi:hypothetical protein